MADAPNPEAIAWYLKRSEGLLNDLRERVQALRIRGGQLAGFSGAVLALAGANLVSVLEVLHGAARDCAAFSLLVGLLFLIVALVTTLRGTLVRELVSDLSAAEVANYTSERFTHEPDLGVSTSGRSVRFSPRSNRRPGKGMRSRGLCGEPNSFFWSDFLQLGSPSLP
jgi:hypothetical protein